MALSKSTRITIMLAIDVVFFFVELGVGLKVKSLALMADAFHMLNDIISLVVGLWAVRASLQTSTDQFSFGWLRAEILGAFFNAVFLIALCLSIIIDAIERLMDPPKIKNPMLILIVGSVGLASNLVGFLVLGGHGHSHGPEEHDHATSDEHSHAEEGRNTHGYEGGDVAHSYSDDTGVGDVLPEAIVAKAKAGVRFKPQGEEGHIHSPVRSASKSVGSSPKKHKRRSSGFITNIEDLSIHPLSFRQEIIAATRPRPEESESSEGEAVGADEAVVDEDDPTECSSLLTKSPGKLNGANNGHKHKQDHKLRHDSWHANHNHNKPKKQNSGGHSHNHADMGMNAMILHVIGDALGNVGVIVSALIIWLTSWSGRFYADPVVSLFITLIILKTAIPLTIATSKILLQATPDHIKVNDIKEDIQDIPGVISCHHVHIWQLSDTQLIASIHIQVAFAISEAGGEKYMELAKAARKCLHAYGIHNATIQPEFCVDKDHHHVQNAIMGLDGIVNQERCRMDDDECLLGCVDNCTGKGCCPSPTAEPQHNHSDHDGHTH